MSTALQVLGDWGDVESGQRINVGDITGTQGRRWHGQSRDEMAREAMSLTLAGIEGADGVEPCDVLDGLAAAERRRHPRSLIGPVGDVSQMLAESADEWRALDADGLTHDAATLAAWRHEASDAGRIMVLAGGVDYTGATERVKVGSERRLVSRVPRGGVVGSVARYTMRRHGGVVSPEVMQDCAAAAVASMWCAWVGTGLDPLASMDGGGDMTSCARALWRIGWRAARRCVIAESRAGRTGAGADRLPAMTVWDSTRPCEGWRPLAAGAVVRSAASVGDVLSLASWAESMGGRATVSPGVLAADEAATMADWLVGGPRRRSIMADLAAARNVPDHALGGPVGRMFVRVLPTGAPVVESSYRVGGRSGRPASGRTGDKSSLRSAAQWLAGVLGAGLPVGLARHHVTARAARSQWRSLVCLLSLAGSGSPAGDARWDRAARAGGFASADALRGSLAAGKVWQRLRAAAIGGGLSDREDVLAARVADCAAVVRDARAVYEALYAPVRGSAVCVPAKLAWRVRASQAADTLQAAAAAMLAAGGDAIGYSIGDAMRARGNAAHYRRAVKVWRGARRDWIAALRAAVPSVRRAVCRRLYENTGALEFLCDARAARARAIREFMAARAARRAAWDSLLVGIWAGRSIRGGGAARVKAGKAQAAKRKAQRAAARVKAA